MIRITIFSAIAGAALLFGSLLASPLALADQCTAKLSCKDPATPKCAFNAARQEWVCIPRNAVFCGQPKRSYYCPAGRSCNGDGTTMPDCR